MPVDTQLKEKIRWYAHPAARADVVVAARMAGVATSETSRKGVLVEAAFEALVSREARVERIEKGNLPASCRFWERATRRGAHAAGKAHGVGIACTTLASSQHGSRYAIAPGLFVLRDRSDLTRIARAARLLPRQGFRSVVGQTDSDRRVAGAAIVAIAKVAGVAGPTDKARIPQPAMCAVSGVSLRCALCERTSIVGLLAVFQGLQNRVTARLVALEMRRRGDGQRVGGGAAGSIDAKQVKTGHTAGLVAAGAGEVVEAAQEGRWRRSVPFAFESHAANVGLEKDRRERTIRSATQAPRRHRHRAGGKEFVGERCGGGVERGEVRVARDPHEELVAKLGVVMELGDVRRVLERRRGEPSLRIGDEATQDVLGMAPEIGPCG